MGRVSHKVQPQRKHISPQDPGSEKAAQGQAEAAQPGVKLNRDSKPLPLLASRWPFDFAVHLGLLVLIPSPFGFMKFLKTTIQLGGGDAHL